MWKGITLYIALYDKPYECLSRAWPNLIIEFYWQMNGWIKCYEFMENSSI